ncbi:DEAD-domain-containing protein [Aspergillus costaricaensis CBS 115574]|uniref:DEAD-domain-containing protein n=1 Tax=Aspergillus costaricaensis CBS 115574 TaxID=1448317 RepID=A0ACD1IB41_9EURO|nr:DEAD-domain-containing protein [Aspergillus costaricaensis CBS 115574]RAK87612.1 DEAD-domain-containing protein [Aspergillus costaricaensis CBS 115574]
MPGRAASPAMSENEFDITNALFQNDSDSDNEAPAKQPKRQPKAAAPEQLDFLNGGGGDDDDDEDDEAFIAETQASANRKASNLKGRTVKKGGGFQAMGLNANLLKAITRKGFSVPTPIQRKTIPVIMEDQDVVGMARTGSGKTAAFVIPMIQKLKSHSTQVGARGLILSPSRELALQTLKVVKELGKGTDLKSVLLVGGDSLEEQFSMMAGNPDIVIATPGRFLHLKVEMHLDLSSIRYVVFDEADRLFEMGFAAQLTEILHGLPSTRQTLLFSATLPKSLVEFARAGLQEPTLVRLDTESKISPDLQNAFFSVKSSDKEGALMYILHNVIKMPTGPTEAAQRMKEENASGKGGRFSKKRKRSDDKGINFKESPTKHSTIIFAATKHHVDYLYSLLKEAGFATSYAYGSLDQTARKIQVHNFRTGISNILVVTDVAARGIDIPILANVINYDFPSQAKIFVHRVGRTARAGRTGWSYSLVRDSDAPYLLDLQLFLGRRLVLGREHGESVSFAEDVVVGGFPRDGLSQSCEWVTKVLDDTVDIAAQRSVASKGEKLYLRTRNAASLESAKRSKEVVSSDNWTALHPLFNDETSQLEAEREKMLARIGGYRPNETIFEVNNRRSGKPENEEALHTIKRVRTTLDSKKKRAQEAKSEFDDDDVPTKSGDADAEDADGAFSDEDEAGEGAADNMSLASETDLEVTFSSYNQPSNKKAKKDASATSFQNPEYFMSYTPNNTNMAEDRAYGVHSGTNANFAQASRDAAMDLLGDEGSRGFGEPRTMMRWDKRHKKYVSRQNDEDGSKGTHLVRGESGAKIAASFRSGRFDAWKKGKRLTRLPRVGEAETPGLGADLNHYRGGRRFKHNKEQAPKRADPLRGDYDKMKKKNEAAKERQLGKFGGAAAGGKSELKNTDDIRLARNLKQKRREKNARPSRKK